MGLLGLFGLLVFKDSKTLSLFGLLGLLGLFGLLVFKDSKTLSILGHLVFEYSKTQKTQKT